MSTPVGQAAIGPAATKRLAEPRKKPGMVWVNCHGPLDNAMPFGGYEQSGIGREMGHAMMNRYTETKSVLILH